MSNLKVMYTNKSDEWETPQDLYNALNIEFNFTLDACANEFNKKCSVYYDKKTDGLKQNWKGHTVYCNPPYSNNKAWVKKCYEQNLINNITIVLLIPARTDTAYFHDYIYNNKNCTIRFIRGRLKFSGSKHNAPFPSMLVIFNKVV